MDFVVLSSSRGTTFQAVLDRMADGSLHARCLGLVTDRPDRGCIEKARAANVPVMIVEKEKNESRDAYDARVLRAVDELGATAKTAVIAALGWMRILSPGFIRRWKHRIINVHPALLPKHGGEGMYGDRVHQAVLDAKDPESGITIHLMDNGVDTGPILLQKTCPVAHDDTVDSLKAKVQTLEKEWYPTVLEMLHRSEMTLPS